MAAEFRISQNLVQAFRDAIIAYDNWAWGSPEDMVLLDGEDFTIGEIADFAADFDDPMPEDVCVYLWIFAEMADQLAVKTFAEGGRCLRRLYDERVRRQAEKWD